MASATVGILRVLLSANTAEFTAAMADAERSVKGWQGTVSTIGQQATAAGALLTSIFTAAFAAIGGGSTKAAMDFESSFANVAKTVDGVSDKTGTLTQSGEALAMTFRNLAKEIPATTDQLNQIAALGGQMGVPIQQLETFTRNVAALGVAVDGISTEEAAQGLAQIGNASGEGTAKIAEMASALVHLGNNSSATEAQILEFTKRLIGAGTTAGMTVPEVMAIGTAMANVGINAEAGGTAMSTVIAKIGIAVSEGGAKVAEFAKIAGMSAEQFAETWRRSPVEAINAFIVGLSSMKASGADLNLTMGEIGTEGIRVADTLKRLAGAGDGVAQSVRIANEGFAAGNKHLEEAEKKYATTANQLQILWNRITDIGITLGNAFLPMLERAVGVIQSLLPVVDMAAKAFAAMPVPIQSVVVIVGALLAAIGPILVAFGLMATAIAPLIPLFTLLVPTIAGVAAIISSLALPIAAIVAALAAMTIAWIKWGDDIKRIVMDTFNAVKTWLVDNWQGSIFQKFVAMLTAMNEFFDAVRVKMIEKAQQIYTGIKSWLVDKLQPVFEFLRPAFDLVVKVWTTAKDTIVNIVTAIYTGVKTWLVDKFQAIVDGIKAKIDAVTQFFKDMKDKVVGNSYVPEMVTLIGAHIARLDGLMVQPVQEFTEDVKLMFAEMRDGVNKKVDQMVEDSEKVPSFWESEVIPRMKQAYENIVSSLSDNLAKMLLGMESFKDGMRAVWETIKQSIASVLSSILHGFIDNFLKGMIGAATSGGSSIAAGLGSTLLSGFQSVLGVMSSIFSSWITWAIAGIGALVGFLSGAFRGGEEGTQVNPARDAFLLQFGPRGTGPGSGFYELGVRLEAAVGSVMAEQLHAALRSADTMAEFNSAVARINQALSGQLPSGGGSTTYTPPTDLVREAPEEFIGEEERLNLLHMAAGGMGTVTRPTLFMAGEDGPEQFAFSGTNKNFPNAAPIEINFNGPVFGEREYIQTTIVDEIITALKVNRNSALTRLQAVAEIR